MDSELETIGKLEKIESSEELVDILVKESLEDLRETLVVNSDEETSEDSVVK